MERFLEEESPRSFKKKSYEGGHNSRRVKSRSARKTRRANRGRFLRAIPGNSRRFGVRVRDARKSYELALSSPLRRLSSFANEPRTKKQLVGNWIGRSAPLCGDFARSMSKAVFLKTTTVAHRGEAGGHGNIINP